MELSSFTTAEAAALLVLAELSSFTTAEVAALLVLAELSSFTTAEVAALLVLAELSSFTTAEAADLFVLAELSSFTTAEVAALLVLAELSSFTHGGSGSPSRFSGTQFLYHGRSCGRSRNGSHSSARLAPMIREPVQKSRTGCPSAPSLKCKKKTRPKAGLREKTRIGVSTV
ncbi:hypothetical protein [Alicyclobacillus ferrooxydans]|uniref:hypothetical protein n=1 Tax=Alicyclobacillus ferrooxydans TaxID=471514 RepID=UPI0012ED8274|nr:hypothetical protein [Alicyclobacillus ferrooxydans]